MVRTVARTVIALVAVIQCFLPMCVVDAQFVAPTVDPTVAPAVAPTNATTAPTQPTFSPTLDPDLTFPECYTNSTVIFQAMIRANSFEQNTYVICPNTVLRIGTPDENDVCCIDGDRSIIPRARSTIMCGDDGKASNNCTVTGGNTQVFFVGGYYGDAISPDIVLMGITFEDADFVSVAMAGRSDITFIDCIWTQHYRSSGTIFFAYSAADSPDNERRFLLEDELMEIEDPWERSNKVMSREFMEAWTREAVAHGEAYLAAGDKSPVVSNGQRGLQSSQSDFIMIVDFINCTFINNIQGPTDVAGIPLFGIVSVLTPFSPVTLDRVDFINNKYDGSDGNQNGFAIQSVGSALEITDCCFEENSFIGFGPVQAFSGAPLFAERNFCTVDDLIACDFAAVTDDSVPNGPEDVTCLAYDLQSCRGAPRIINSDPSSSPVKSSSDAWFRIGTLLMLSWFALWLLLL